MNIHIALIREGKNRKVKFLNPVLFHLHGSCEILAVWLKGF
jgi:hypothetical protein